jgi:Mg2+/Co2+ transporter CorC
MAKHLGRVPIPGSTVEVDGLVFRAEEAKGRRNRIGTVLITPPSSAPRPTPPAPVEAPEVRA